MMKENKPKYSEKTLKAICDVLIRLIVECGESEKVCDVVEKIQKQYGLMDDPFTLFPCTPKEYCENSLEYQRQMIIEKYGHCDGVE